LPNVLEIGSLGDFSQLGPALPPDHPFDVTNADTYWTSTTTAAVANRAWTVGMGIGKISDLPKGTLQQVWPVRGGMAVHVDIKPGSCENPINEKSRGVLPVAILGTADFDVTTIDPVTIRLAGVAPIRSAVEDVAAPAVSGAGFGGCGVDCTDEGPDGWDDLTLKFRNQEIIAALNHYQDRECLELKLTGHLLEEFGGTLIDGGDVVSMRANPRGHHERSSVKAQLQQRATTTAGRPTEVERHGVGN
jgi:hypothetical protein